MVEREPDGELLSQDAEDGDVLAERDPEISEADRFFVNGRAMPFDEWVASVMEPIGPREPASAEPQPAPVPAEVVWMSRRPVEER
jgi:hypothetical protein